MKIRKATIMDIDILTDFWYQEEKYNKKFVKNPPLKNNAKKLISVYLKKHIKKNNYIAFIASDNDKNIGAIHGQILKGYFIYTANKVGHLGTSFVKKEYRRRGVAKLLHNRLISWFKSKKIDYVDLYVYPKNKITLSTWNKFGFEEIMRNMNKKI
jgi:ribosomal protein S18 acetylase RimI-like enzyme